MNLTCYELKRLLRLVLKANMHEQSLQLNEDLLRKLSIEFAIKTIEKDSAPFQEKIETKKSEPAPFAFETSTKSLCRKLQVREGELRVAREVGQLRKGYHYTTGKNPKPSAIWYDIRRTCVELHSVSLEEFSRPGFDVEANTRKQVSRAFAKARKGAKK